MQKETTTKAQRLEPYRVLIEPLYRLNAAIGATCGARANKPTRFSNLEVFQVFRRFAINKNDICGAVLARDLWHLLERVAEEATHTALLCWLPGVLLPHVGLPYKS